MDIVESGKDLLGVNIAAQVTCGVNKIGIDVITGRKCGRKKKSKLLQRKHVSCKGIIMSPNLDKMNRKQTIFPVQ